MASIRKAVILGTNGNCIDILDTLLDLNDAADRPGYECIGFLDDNPATWDRVIHGVKVLGPLEAARDLPDAWFVNGIGSTATFWKKEAIIARTGVGSERFLTLVHPSAQVSRFARLSPGVVVLQRATITAQVWIGEHVIVLPGAVVSHDTVVGAYSCVAGGVCLSGKVTVGKACYLGSNCTVREGVTLGDYSLVGMGSVVLNDVPANTVVVGNPARPLRQTRAA
jgi:sugar O-acyltransferase (sialic acid O-acetyltransferase NeuD family)